jgi:hypothetical protein
MTVSQQSTIYKLLEQGYEEKEIVYPTINRREYTSVIMQKDERVVAVNHRGGTSGLVSTKALLIYNRIKAEEEAYRAPKRIKPLRLRTQKREKGVAYILETLAGETFWIHFRQGEETFTSLYGWKYPKVPDATYRGTKSDETLSDTKLSEMFSLDLSDKLTPFIAISEEYLKKVGLKDISDIFLPPGFKWG